jgi:hypothetical protein
MQYVRQGAHSNAEQKGLWIGAIVVMAQTCHRCISKHRMLECNIQIIGVAKTRTKLVVPIIECSPAFSLLNWLLTNPIKPYCTILMTNFKASNWTRESQKACFGLEVKRLVDDVFKVWDWKRASQKACCGLEVKVGSV